MSNIQFFINEAINGNMDSSRHHITLFALSIAQRAKNILELGVRQGHTTLPFLEALSHTDGFLTSVDIQEHNPLRTKFSSYKNWNYIISDAILFLENLKDKHYDIVYIDDWHDGEHLYKEIQLVEKHISPSSLILIHDCMCFHTEPNYHIYKDATGEFGNGGPYAAVKKLDPEIWEYSTIPVSNGLTILRKKGKVLTF